MKAFFGGQIKREYRGDLAVIVDTSNPPLHSIPQHSVLIYPASSDEFINLTSVKREKNPIDRVYLGVSQQAGEIVKSVEGRLAYKTDLGTIDAMLVDPIFLDESHDKPQRIVLEATVDGYQVTEVE